MKALILFSLLLLTACKPTTEEKTQSFTLPKGLEDCKIYTLNSGEGVILYVTRCPNSVANTTPAGKSPAHVMVIDGVEYIKKEDHGSSTNTNK